MEIRPYLTFDGECEEALELYGRAFSASPGQVMRFSDLPSGTDFPVPDEYAKRVVQATLKIGDGFIRLSDCGPQQFLNDARTERVSIAVETDVEGVKLAFETLAETGEIGMPLAETFYSPCAGVVFDKFGVMWNLVAQV